MEYYELSQSKKVENPIELMGLDPNVYCYTMARKDFEALDKIKVAYFSGNEAEEICDILISPTYTIRKQNLKVFSFFQHLRRASSIQYTGCQVFQS